MVGAQPETSPREKAGKVSGSASTEACCMVEGGKRLPRGWSVTVSRVFPSSSYWVRGVGGSSAAPTSQPNPGQSCCLQMLCCVLLTATPADRCEHARCISGVCYVHGLGPSARTTWHECTNANRIVDVLKVCTVSIHGQCGVFLRHAVRPMLAPHTTCTRCSGLYIAQW